MWHWQPPTHASARWSIACVLGYLLMWVGQVLVVDPWAQTPIDNFSQRLTIMMSYAVVQIAIGVGAGGFAVWAVWRAGERSRWLWVPLMLGGVLVLGVARAFLMP